MKEKSGKSIILLFCLLFFMSGCGTQAAPKATQEKESATESAVVEELLSEYIDEDTRIIYMDYDGIEEDMASYHSDAADAIEDEEERSTYVRSALGREHLLAELKEALEKREDKICVIGMFFSGIDGYMNSLSLGLDNGMIRSLPYSTFWLKSYSGLRGYLPDGDNAFGERWFVYDFEYYPLSEDEISEMKTEIDREAEDIISCIPEDADLWTQHRLVHDELIRRLTYDLAYEDHCHDLYGALVKQETVCEGYALAYKDILNRMGYSCDVVVSNWDEDNKGHAWNRIYAPTFEEYIDVTWDDPDMLDEDGEPFIGYDFFGLTKEEIESIESHSFDLGFGVWFSEPETFNYYRHEGYLLDYCDEDEILDLFYEQYANGSNYLTVRFADEEIYDEARELLANEEEMNYILTELGYYGSYWWQTNDGLRIFSVGLLS